MAKGNCRDCGQRLDEANLPSYEPTCPECGCLYPLSDAGEAAGELAKDKTAKRAGCVIAIATAIIVTAAVAWYFFNR